MTCTRRTHTSAAVNTHSLSVSLTNSNNSHAPLAGATPQPQAHMSYTRTSHARRDGRHALLRVPRVTTAVSAVQLLPAHCPLLNGSKVQINSLPLARRLRHLSVKSDRCREREAARPPRAHKRANGHSFSRLPYLKPSEPLPRRRPHPSAAVNAALGCCAPFPSRRTCAADGDALTQGSPWFADRARPNDEPSSQ